MSESAYKVKMDSQLKILNSNNMKERRSTDDGEIHFSQINPSFDRKYLDKFESQKKESGQKNSDNNIIPKVNSKKATKNSLYQN